MSDSENIIRSLRKQRGFTQKDLAEKAGISVRTLQRVEADASHLQGFTLQSLAKAFDLEPQALLPGSVNTAEPIVPDPEAQRIALGIINLGTLGFFLLPFGNILLPFLLWSHRKGHPEVDDGARRILNFQVLWTLGLALLMIAAPFVQSALQIRLNLIFVVMIPLVLFNLYVILRTGSHIQQGRKDFLMLKFRLF